MKTDHEDKRTFSTLAEMFQARNTPAANRDFIAHAFDDVEVIEIVETRSYVKVVRGHGADLRIYRSIICGYSTEKEALRLSGAPHAVLSKSRPGSWSVELPERAGNGGAVRAGAREKKPSWMRTPCPKCRYLMNEQRECTNCA
ncbi:hypothetical protein GCM10009786_03380 [Leucobacter alluvii]|uniref:Uncharacterized protein n=1 Tax=Leucobacter alluvii TaxID=340321 RepID=A0ABN3B3L2_9MICO